MSVANVEDTTHTQGQEPGGRGEGGKTRDNWVLKVKRSAVKGKDMGKHYLEGKADPGLASPVLWGGASQTHPVQGMWDGDKGTFPKIRVGDGWKCTGWSSPAYRRFSIHNRDSNRLTVRKSRSQAVLKLLPSESFARSQGEKGEKGSWGQVGPGEILWGKTQ